VGRDLVYPSNVLYLATESSNQNHAATFPIALPEWFIKLFTKEGDIVLDPFVGSGTTCVAAKQLCRNYVGIDTLEDYVHLASERLEKTILKTMESLFRAIPTLIGTHSLI
jgi:site-specific DNA-methyltransferase (adenine-specific)